MWDLWIILITAVTFVLAFGLVRWLELAVAVALLVYLVDVLIRPERF